MKKLFLATFLLLIYSVSFSQKAPKVLENDLIVKGNVGVGTNNPSAKLDVRGDLILDSGRNSRLYTGHDDLDNNRFLLLLNSPTHRSASGLKTGGLLVSDSYNYANPSKNDLIVKGRVGIGTVAPDAKLSVNGVIHAKEVKVDLKGWADFVFDRGYELPTLKEVENHINEKGHLKDIPSAKEVLENGLKLGEMNKKLLQKIEELTLYTIQQQKEINLQKEKLSKLEVLEKRLKELELLLVALKK